jgi:hypothetical protein
VDGSLLLVEQRRISTACFVFAPIQQSAWKSNSRKFGVASDPSSAAPSTLQRHGATLSASKHGDQVAFVSAFCIKPLRLVTPQLPEKPWPIGPGARTNFAVLRSRKLADVEGHISGILGLPNAATSTHPVEVGR